MSPRQSSCAYRAGPAGPRTHPAGAPGVPENREYGEGVNFDLAATDSRTGVRRQYTGTDTGQNGIIAAADLVQTS
jgi:hypothetical protein